MGLGRFTRPTYQRAARRSAKYAAAVVEQVVTSTREKTKEWRMMEKGALAAVLGGALFLLVSCDNNGSTGPAVNISGTYQGVILVASGQTFPLTVIVNHSGDQITGSYSSSADSGSIDAVLEPDYDIRGTVDSENFGRCNLTAQARGTSQTITQLGGTIGCPGQGAAEFQVNR